MDKTVLYFEMSNCPEIQNHHKKWEEGDYYTVQKGGAAGMVFVYSGEGEDEPPKMYDPIWLPTQDRIQEMLFGTFDNPIYHTELFATFHKTWRWLDLMTMEQLWLTFYMYQKHGKIWTGKEWADKMTDKEKAKVMDGVKAIKEALK